MLAINKDNSYTLSLGLAEVKPEENSIVENRTVIAPAKADAQPFSLKVEIEKLYDSPRRDMNVIALYLEQRKPDIQSRAQLSVAIKRHLRPAKDLVPFTDDQILNAIPRAKGITSEWTLETLGKVLTK